MTDETKTGTTGEDNPAFGPRQKDLDPIGAGNRAIVETVRTSTAGQVVEGAEPRDETKDYDAQARATRDPRASPPFADG
jgi:hypothetical protein